MRSNVVVVGVDGSPAAGSALHWAAVDAVRTGAGLRVIHALRRHRPAAGTDRVEDVTREQAESVVRSAVDQARAQQPGIDVSGAVVVGDAAGVLGEHSRDAGLVVVGNRGHNALYAALLGSVGVRLAAHAAGPVVVVRGRTDAMVGPVIVGVDGCGDDDRLLDAGFAHAAKRGCGVIVLQCWTAPAPSWGSGLPPPGSSPVLTRASLHAELVEEVGRWQQQHPTVPAEARMPGGDPAGVLLDASRAGQLLVVGRQGYHRAAGLLPGPVGQLLLHHADCPVLVVPPGGSAHVIREQVPVRNR